MRIEDTDTFISEVLKNVVCEIKFADRSVQYDSRQNNLDNYYLCKLVLKKAKTKTTKHVWVPENYMRLYLEEMCNEFDSCLKKSCTVVINGCNYTRSRRDGTSLPTRIPVLDHKFKWIKHLVGRLNKTYVSEVKERICKVR